MVAWALLCAAPTIAQRPGDGDTDHFERHIRPLLTTHCTSCHGANGKLKSELDLTTRAGWQKGGTRGPAIVPGDPDNSLLIQALEHSHADIKMPPKGKLKADEIGQFRIWVASGAPDPREGEAAHPGLRMPTEEETRRHWAFLPITMPNQPEVRDEEWVRSPIDQFILKQLEDHGLTPSPEADRRTLIRRASIALIGLPPTPEQVREFIEDTAPNAFEKLVDRLLASPAYGERQARMWLDLARYADSNGVDENLAMAEAFRYRDYVVRSFNQDKPYDQFVREQLAGDLLPPPQDEQALFDQWIATGFLVLGPKMLAEQDKEKLVMDVVDEQLDVAGKAILGMTIGCARCHDHKFDPISHDNYYSLAGILRSTKTMGNLNFVSRWNERELGTAEQIKARNAWVKKDKRLSEALKAARATVHKEARAEVLKHIEEQLLLAFDKRQSLDVVQADSAARTNLNRDDSNWGSKDCVILHTSSPDPVQYAEWEIMVEKPGAHLITVRYASQDSRPMKLLVNGTLIDSEALKEKTGGYHPKSQKWVPVATLSLKSGKNLIRLEREGPIPHINALLLTSDSDSSNSDPLGFVSDRLALELGSNPALAVWSHAQDLESLKNFKTKNPYLRDLLQGLPVRDAQDLAVRHGLLFRLLSREAPKSPKDKPDKAGALSDKNWQELRKSLFGPAGALTPSINQALRLAKEPSSATYRSCEAALKQHRLTSKPTFDRALCVSDGEVKNIPIHLRGNHLTLAKDPTPRGFLDAVDHLFPETPIGKRESGRLQWAQRITDKRHPLTARVIANRIWASHFGFGICRTPSNFGFRGAPPTHPKLLDYLAVSLMKKDWSLKKLHREILLTSTWRMRSHHRADAFAADPENRLLWRFNRQRLDAEVIRDAILSLSGRLDRKLSGTLLATKNGGYVTNDQSGNGAKYDSRRRALYLPIIRNAMYGLFTTFDYNDPSVPIANRPKTVIPSQALFFMNSDLVIEEARHLAGRIIKDQPSTRERIRAAFQSVFQRDPTKEEIALSLRYIAGDSQEDLSATQLQEVWGRYIHSLYASSEFLFVD